jgi:hypothetical protein
MSEDTATSQPPFDILSLPDEMIHRISSHLSHRDARSLSLVCRKLEGLTAPRVWGGLCMDYVVWEEREYPDWTAWRLSSDYDGSRAPPESMRRDQAVFKCLAMELLSGSNCDVLAIPKFRYVRSLHLRVDRLASRDHYGTEHWYGNEGHMYLDEEEYTYDEEEEDCAGEECAAGIDGTATILSLAILTEMSPTLEKLMTTNGNNKELFIYCLHRPYITFQSLVHLAASVAYIQCPRLLYALLNTIPRLKRLELLDVPLREEDPEEDICRGSRKCSDCRVRVDQGSQTVRPPEIANLASLEELYIGTNWHGYSSDVISPVYPPIMLEIVKHASNLRALDFEGEIRNGTTEIPNQILESKSIQYLRWRAIGLEAYLHAGGYLGELRVLVLSRHRERDMEFCLEVSSRFQADRRLTTRRVAQTVPDISHSRLAHLVFVGESQCPGDESNPTTFDDKRLLVTPDSLAKLANLPSITSIEFYKTYYYTDWYHSHDERSWMDAQAAPASWEEREYSGLIIRTYIAEDRCFTHIRAYLPKLLMDRQTIAEYYRFSRPSAGTDPFGPYGDRSRYYDHSDSEWIDYTEYKGELVPLSVLEKVYASGNMPMEWLTGGRGMQLSEQCWTVLKDWHASLGVSQPGSL